MRIRSSHLLYLNVYYVHICIVTAVNGKPYTNVIQVDRGLLGTSIIHIMHTRDVGSNNNTMFTTDDNFGSVNGGMVTSRVLQYCQTPARTRVTRAHPHSHDIVFINTHTHTYAL